MPIRIPSGPLILGRGGGLQIKSGSLGYRATVLADSPVAFWRLGEPSGATAADVQGTHDGTYSNCTLNQTGATTDGNKAAAFSAGSNSLITVSSAADLQFTNAMTFECWANPTNASAFYMLITKGSTNGSPNSDYEWRLDNTTGKQRFLVNAGAGVVSNTQVPTGQFNHIAVTFDGANARFYLNGVADGAPALAATAATHATNVILGRRGDGLSFTGTLDEIAVYGSVLSPARIAAHFAAR